MGLLRGADGRLLLGWRLPLYVGGFVAIVIAGDVVAGAGPWPRESGAVVGGLLSVALLLPFTRFFRLRVDRADWRGMALPHPRDQGRGVGAGLLAGVLGIAALFGLEWGLGFARVAGTEFTALGLASVLIGLVQFGCVGFIEELAVRGYVLQNLAEGRVLWVATAVTGLLFGLLHAPNAGFTPAFAASAVVMTVLLVVLRLRARSLWPAIGWHAGWDWGQSQLIGLAAVGDAHPAPSLVRITQAGPAWLVGVAPAIESGLLAVILECLSLAVLIALCTPGVAIDWRGSLTPEGQPGDHPALAPTPGGA